MDSVAISPDRVALELMSIATGEEQIDLIHIAVALDQGFEVETYRGWYIRFERLNSDTHYIVGRVVAPDSREVELADWRRAGLMEPLELLRLAHPEVEDQFLAKVELAESLAAQIDGLKLPQFA